MAVAYKQLPYFLFNSELFFHFNLLKMKNIFNILIICGIVLTFAMLTSCEKKYFVPGDEPIEDVSFSNDLQPFFDAKCISCHDGGGIPLNLTSPGSYEALINGNPQSGGEYIDETNPANSVLYTKIIPGGSMNQYDVTPTNSETTLVWITEGANDN